MIFRSLRFKLILWYVLILAVVIGISDIILYNIFERNLVESIDNTLYSAAEEVQHAMLLSPSTRWQRGVEKIEKAFIVNRVFINIYLISPSDRGGLRLVARSRILLKRISSDHIHHFLESGQTTRPLSLSINEKSQATHPFRIILFPMEKNNQLTHVIQVGTSLKKVFSTMAYFQMIMLLFAAIILIITSLGGYFILTKALRPVKNAAQTARTISTEDLSLRIDNRGRRDEIGDLIRTFNDMIERLEKSVEQIKNYSTEVSHELKTPLTIIRGEIEITLRKERQKEEYRKTLQSVFDEAVKLEKMVNSLLLLSHIITHSDHFTLGQVPLDEMVLKTFEQSVALARKKKINLVMNRIDPVSIIGEETLLNRMIMNILENAIKYTDAGGTVELALENRKNGTVLTIRDNGVGIPRRAIPRVFDRFYTVEKDARGEVGGLGLGLAIVKRIADIHGASIKIQSQPSRGTLVKIIFPPHGESGPPAPPAKIKNF